jgi:hypothetical protein
MGRYIRKHKRQFAGIAFPVLFLFILAAFSFSVFPGWLKPSYGVPGTPCTGSFNNTACDPCNGEVCVFNSSVGSSQCAVFDVPSGTATFDSSATAPQCPGGWLLETLHGGNPAYPSCFTICTATFDTFSVFVPICQPDDGFCEGISGGTQDNLCRSGTCLADSTFDPFNPTVDPGNPSGCDYDYSGGVDCINCAPPADPAVNCGNGVCEQDSGEDFDSCALDCAAPGFDAIASQSTLDAACNVVITFPDNTPFFGLCEDGDVCTTNVCSGLTCDVQPAACDDSVIDFCCPGGCTPSDDLDCLTPEVCEPTPSPSPTPTISPADLSGTGCSLHKGE